MDKDVKGIWRIFTILYFADVFTSLFAAILWGDFPDTNMYMISLVNSILYWVIFKTVCYLLILIVFRWIERHSSVSDNILISVTVIYAIVIMNNLASVTMQFPVFNITPEFYSSIEAGRIEMIP
jgi:uncharacterized membrane protein YwaF